MRYLGLDLGTRTLGTSISDPTLTIASSYKTIRFDDSNYQQLLPEIKNIVDEFNISKIVLGLPKNMDNSMGFASERSLKFKELLETKTTKKIHLVDERLSTVEAERFLISTDTSRMKRKKIIDAYAANVILDTYLKSKKG